MKKLLFFVLAAALATNLEAQMISPSKVPAAVTNGFKKHHPDVKSVTWEAENGNFEANYKKNGGSYSEVFDKNGNLLETEVDIKVSELPAAVPGYVKSHYKSPIKEASKITKSNGEVEYEAALNDKDVIFDANGKYQKEVKEEKGAKEKKQ